MLYTAVYRQLTSIAPKLRLGVRKLLLNDIPQWTLVPLSWRMDVSYECGLSFGTLHSKT